MPSSLVTFQASSSRAFRKYVTRRNYRREKRGRIGEAEVSEGRTGVSATPSLEGNRVLVSGRDVPYYKFDSTGVTALGGPSCRLLSYCPYPLYREPVPPPQRRKVVSFPSAPRPTGFPVALAFILFVWPTNLVGMRESGAEEHLCRFFTSNPLWLILVQVFRHFSVQWIFCSIKLCERLACFRSTGNSWADPKSIVLGDERNLFL